MLVLEPGPVGGVRLFLLLRSAVSAVGEVVSGFSQRVALLDHGFPLDAVPVEPGPQLSRVEGVFDLDALDLGLNGFDLEVDGGER